MWLDTRAESRWRPGRMRPLRDSTRRAGGRARGYARKGAACIRDGRRPDPPPSQSGHRSTVGRTRGGAARRGARIPWRASAVAYERDRRAGDAFAHDGCPQGRCRAFASFPPSPPSVVRSMWRSMSCASSATSRRTKRRPQRAASASLGALNRLDRRASGRHHGADARHRRRAGSTDATMGRARSCARDSRRAAGGHRGVTVHRMSCPWSASTSSIGWSWIFSARCRRGSARRRDSARRCDGHAACAKITAGCHLHATTF